MNEKEKIVIVGIGDVFEKHYWEEFEALNLNQFEVLCVDNKSYWQGDVLAKRTRTKKKIEEAGFRFINSQNESEYHEFIRTNKFAAVIIAVPDFVHIKEIKNWIDADVARIIVEKPLSDKSSEVDLFLRNTLVSERNLNKIKYFDHYRGKLHKYFANKEFIEMLYADLQTPLRKIRFFCLEDFSGTHKDYIEKEETKGNKIFPEFNGSIEVVGREKALNKGMIFDLGSHMLAVLEYFGETDTLEINKIWAGRYVGVGDKLGNLNSEIFQEDGSFDKRIMETTKIENETFAAFHFQFKGDKWLKNGKDHKILGEAYVGKGIRGIENPNNFNLNLSVPIIGEVKLIEFESETNRKVQFYLKREKRNENKMKRIIGENGNTEEEGEFQIFKAHKIAFEETLNPPNREEIIQQKPMFLSIYEAQKLLKKLEEIQSKIKNEVLPYYSLGRRNRNKEIIISYPEYLDSIMARFEPIWEKSKS